MYRTRYTLSTIISILFILFYEKEVNNYLCILINFFTLLLYFNYSEKKCNNTLKKNKNREKA